MVKANEVSAHDSPPPNLKIYLAVFGLQLVMLSAILIASHMRLPRHEVVGIGIVACAIMAFAVAAFNMQALHEKKLIHAFIGVTFFFALLNVIPLLEGYFIRPRLLRRVSVAEQHPDESASAPPADAGAAK